jgi:integrase
MTGRHYEHPLRRVNPSGQVRWVGRYTARDGKRRSAGTFEKRGPCKEPGDGCCAQHAIDAAHEAESGARAPRTLGTLDAYREHWTRMHPRSERTARTYAHNLRAALDVQVGGLPLKDWRLDELERSEIAELLDHLLRVDGRAANGARAVLRTLSAMFEDAISDGWTKHNPVAGLRLRSTDPRVQKRPRTIQVYGWEQMHALAAAAPGPYGEAMVRCLADLGLRLGEMLPLERGDIDGDWVWVRRTAHDGRVEAGTKTTRERPEKARRTPLPPELAGILRGLPPRIDTPLLFPAVRGGVYQQRVFYRDVWRPACEAAGMEGATPHELRHSYVSLMRAAGVDPADLADATGHTVQTAMAYTHSTGTSWDAMRSAVG